MTGIKVKVCGLTREEDALLASELGASALGFVFARSPRKVPSSIVNHIVRSVREKRKDLLFVGVFANPDLIEVLQILDEAGLNAVQFHGQESPEFIAVLKSVRPDIFIIKAITVTDAGFELNPTKYDAVDVLLFDSTGPRDNSKPRSLIPLNILKAQPIQKPFIVAGGLNAENVRGVLREVEPIGVDVSSGVESSPGLKCSHKLKSFFKEAVAARKPDQGEHNV